VKAQHRRRAPYCPRLEFAIGLLALAVCGLGIGRITADVIENHRAAVIPREPTTTTTMIDSAIIEPETTTTVQPTTTTTTTVPRLAGRGSPAPVIKKAVATVASPSSTTTTTEAPKTPLEVAQAEVGKTGPYAVGGFWCAKFVSWIAEQSKIENFQQSDSPARLHKIAMDEGRIVAAPFPGYLVFIDLTGQNFANQYISHVGIVESVDGDEIVIIQGNGNPDPSVVTRTTYRVGDGFVIAFAEFNQGAP
jgi:hypothetical protein